MPASQMTRTEASPAALFGAAATPTSNPLPIQTDTNPSTQGVFLGEVCGTGTAVPCIDFGRAYRKTPAIATVYANWDTHLVSFIDTQGIPRWNAQGTTPEITWEPDSAVTTVTFAAINLGLYDSYLNAEAIALKGYGKPVLLRPFHEFNGDWYPWGLSLQGSNASVDAAFISAWKRMYTIFHKNGASNVKFIWCFATATVPSATVDPWNAPIAAYPGDAYVDWIGFDAYNRGNDIFPQKWKNFDDTIAPSYQEALTISSVKPIIVSETASNEYGDGGAMKAQWLASLTTELASPTATNSYPHIRAISYFDTNITSLIYSLRSTHPVFHSWVTGIRTIGPHGIPNLRGNGNALMNVTTWQN